MTLFRRSCALAALLIAAACAAPAPEVAQPLEAPSRRAAVAAPERTRVRVPAVALLPRRALELEHHGQPLAALRLIAKELGERVDTAAWSDPALVAESVVAGLSLERLVNNARAWDEGTASIARLKPFPRETPPELAAQLDLVLAQCLRSLGRVDEARALSAARGVISDWMILGPFANERGGGHDTPYAPEEQLAGELDLATAVRGKERDVAWRANPCPQHPLGALRLDEMLRPNEQATAYLATAIELKEAREVVLQLGSTGSLKVFHGALEVLSRKVERPFHPDQDRVVLALQPGWNRVLVKLGIEEREPWVFAARLTELDGSPVRGMTVDLEHAGGATKAVAATSKPAPSALELLEARAGDAEAARLVTQLHLWLHPDDEAARTAKAWSEKACALEPDDVQGLYLSALANEPARGATREEIQVNARLFPLKEVLARDARHVAALLDLAEFSLRENPTPERADQLTAQAFELAPASWRAAMLRADVLEMRGRAAQAQMLTERARDLEEGRLHPFAVHARTQQLKARGQLDASLAAMREAVSRGAADEALTADLIATLIDRGDLDGALGVLRAELERVPFETSRMLATAELVEHAGDVPRARELVQRALHVCPEHTGAHLALARLAQRDGDLATADSELAEVLRLDPGYDKARRQRQILAATVEARFEEPYRWDALERVVATPPSSAGNDPVSVVDRTSVWRVNADGTEHRYEHLLLRAQNLGGVKRLDSYAISYPSDATLQVYNVRVIRPDKSFERAPAPRRGDFNWGGELARPFDLPPLEAGDYVELEYRIDQTRADVFGQYFGVRHEFYADFPDPLAPVTRSELVVISPADVPLYVNERRPELLERSQSNDAEGNVVRRWIARDLERPALQSAMPPRSEFAPAVDVSTFESWQAFASWWWNLVEKEFVTSPAMKSKVAELTAGLATEADKVQAIARFVGQEIRYNSWPFGTHGYEPFSAATIFERRFGDCKDKSILLRQMLAEIGVEAHPVIINAQSWRPAEFLEVAMIGAFNHCIAYLPATEERAGYYLDATADRNPIEYLRSDDQGATVVHVRDGQGSLHTIPYAPPEQNALVREYDVALELDGSGRVRLVDQSNGAFGVGLRYAFGGEKGDLNKRIGEALAEQFGKVDVVEATTSPLEDIAVPARLETVIRSQGLWSRDASGANLRLGFDDIPLLQIAPEPPNEREFDLVLDRPFELRTRVLYRLPAGAKVGRLPPDADVVAPGLLEYRMTARETPEGVEVRRDFKLFERRIGVERYADFRGALRDVELAESRTVLIETPASDAQKEQK